MKKIFLFIIVGILLMNFEAVVSASSYNTEKTLQKSIEYKTMIISEFFPNAAEFEIINSKDGQKIKNDNYNYLMDPGKPLLPSKNLLIALPPGAKVISVNIEGIKAEQLQGNFMIIPSSIILPLDGLDLNNVKVFKDQWRDNYESVYSSDDPYPCQVGKLVCSGTFRKYSYALVSVYPFEYHPKSGNLFLYDSVQITINYEISPLENIEKMKQDNLFDQKASELFVNYNEIKNLYKPQESSFSLKEESYNYVIVTTSDLYNTISSSNFISWKNTIGYNILIVNVTDSVITTQPGIDLAEQIRNFLRNYYIDWGIEFVLIVGDYTTVPMRYCYPDPSNHKNTAGTPGGTGGEIPTDYYYADLSSPDSESWDFDGDGYLGEFIQDKPDFLPEVYVGRIPINDPAKILYTFEKTVAFEQDTGNWKKNALNAGAFFYFTEELGDGLPSMDGAKTCAYIEDDIMNGWTISHYSEQEGLEKSIYQWNPLSDTAFTTDWRDGKYSIVNWGAHGWTDRIARKIWSWDDGDNIPEANEITWPNLLSTSSNLDDDYPSVVTAISCLVGYPEPNSWGNMGIDLLTKPSYGSSIGVISSVRTPYGNLDWPSSPGASDSIIYEFNRYLIEDSEKVGEALFDSKYYCNINYNWYGWVEYNDLYTFNLYGDPSLSINGINIEGRPSKPDTPYGPTAGKIGMEYTYSSSTTDPDNDNIYYMFDWGDTYSGWLGPYESGMICQSNHSWMKKGIYEIKVKAKDINGLVSEWSDPLVVTIAKDKAIIAPFINFLKNHLNLFYIIHCFLEL